MTVLALLFAQSASGGIRGSGEEGRLSGVRIPFVANSGQTHPAVAYYAPTFAGTVFVTRDGRIVYSLHGTKTSASGGRSSVKRERKAGWSLTETAVGASVRPSGVDRTSSGVSYFHGNDPARWRSGVPTFEGVSLGEVWPGISLALRAHGRNVEKVFTVEPGADPSRIRMSVAGAQRLRTDRAGALVASTGLGDVTFTPPAAYQEHRNVRRPVRVVYQVRGRQYGFRLDSYDPALPVVIDPLLQATYLGGSGGDSIHPVAIDPVSGDVYVAGACDSTDFPGTAGGPQPAYGGGGNDAFVARLNAGLTTLKQATYLGGSGDEELFGLAIDPTSGDVFVAGHTNSTDFPGTAGGAQPANGGGFVDVFVARLNAGLTTLKQATYLGGSGQEGAAGLSVHPASGDVYVAGSTNSTDFPGTTGGAQAANGGDLDAFVARLNAGLTTLKQATYLGGSGSDSANVSLAIHPVSGDVYAAGVTTSTDFPGTLGGAQPASGGGTDAFLARLNAGLTTLLQATYLGGSGAEALTNVQRSLVVDPASGDVYVAGDTNSTDFPGTAGGAQSDNAGDFDGFIARLNAGLTTLKQATYLGGGGFDHIFGLAFHPTSGDVYVAGGTRSTDFPRTAGGAQASSGGDLDAFAARLNAGLTTLKQATYLGGSDFDIAYSMAIHPASGDVYLAGFVFSTNFPGTAGGAQPDSGGIPDAFVARLTADLTSGTSRLLTALSPAKVWVGLKNGDDVGIRVDLLAEVFIGNSKIGGGQVNNVSTGSSGFNNAVLGSIPLSLSEGPIAVPASFQLKLLTSVRRTCFGGGHASGTPRLWYNGQPIDSFTKTGRRDAGSRFGTTIDGTTDEFFLRGGFTLSVTPGSSRQFVDVGVNSKEPCPGRSFKPFGTWSTPAP